MSNNPISKYIRKIANTNKFVDLYSDSNLVDFYNDSSSENDFFDDIKFYMNNIGENERVVELAAGSGRILYPLANGGRNIIGIEKEPSMIESKIDTVSTRIIQADIMNFSYLEKIYSNANVFILGATTISLFSEKEMTNFFKELNRVNSNYRIYFDFFDMNLFITKYPGKVINTNGTYYYHNFLDNNKVIYNLYHKESRTLGVSVKHVYDINKVQTICHENNMDFRVEKYLSNYYMINAYYKKYK
ncbi:hypothetical protein [Staphylococcus aureus]|uniref:class I SAM-dependent methyltransferase n=1 Tax=Staphylococcus aureus TaxID=1280 RepID=UPI003364D878